MPYWLQYGDLIINLRNTKSLMYRYNKAKSEDVNISIARFESAENPMAAGVLPVDRNRQNRMK
jgi:hypothetical protein